MFKFLFLFLMMSFPLNESLYLHRFEFRFLTFHPLLLPSSSIDRVNWPWSWVDDCCLCYNIPPQKINRDSDFICHSANLSSCHFPLFQFHLTYMIFACTCLFAVAAISRSSKRLHCQNLNIQRHLFHRFHLFIQIVLWVNWHFIFMIQIPLNWLSVQPVIQPDFVTRSSALFQLPFVIFVPSQDRHFIWQLSHSDFISRSLLTTLLHTYADLSPQQLLLQSVDLLLYWSSPDGSNLPTNSFNLRSFHIALRLQFNSLDSALSISIFDFDFRSFGLQLQICHLTFLFNFQLRLRPRLHIFCWSVQICHSTAQRTLQTRGLVDLQDAQTGVDSRRLKRCTGQTASGRPIGQSAHTEC